MSRSFPGIRRQLPSALLVAGVLLAGTAPAGAQNGAAGSAHTPDTVSVVPAARFRAGPIYSFLFGRHYRDLWTSPVRVEVLDLGQFAGGLTPTRRGGGNQTKSLRFRGADGREYVFRSVEKDPSTLDAELRETFAGHVIRDQSKSLHPAAPLIVSPLLDAVGVLHAKPRLVVMPDDPALGEFRADFGGMLGTIEERPGAGPDGEPGFAGALEVVDTDELLKRIERDPAQRVDSRAYLTARLLDLLLGDWDRHPDQWRWALLPGEGGARWVPIPRDRDQALVRYDGLLLHIARQQYPKVVLFGPRYGNLYGLTESSIELDRRLLPELPRPAWESAVVSIQQALTDAVIEDAVRRMPPEFYERTGEDLSRTLKARRERLPDAADWLYSSVNSEVDVHASDEADVAIAERQEGGRLSVALYRRGPDGQPRGEPYFDRVFDRSETREVRLILHGGRDYAAVRGDARRAPRLRVVGGGGDDELVDSTGVADGAVHTLFYDARGENRFVTGPGTAVDTRPYTPPVYERSRIRDRHRDWGTRQFITPWLEYSSEYGAVIGGGPTLYRYGFRQVPYASRISLRAAYATGAEAGALEFNGRFYRANSDVNLSVLARISGVELARFYGLGNDAPATQPDIFYRVRQRQMLVEPILNLAPARRLRFSVGPVIQHSDTYDEANTFIGETRPYGSGSFGQIGLRSGVALDTRDHSVAATRGMRLEVGGSVFPRAWDVVEPFGEAHATLSTYLTAPVAAEPTLALRVAGKRIWGDAPFHELAWIGGSRSVRGLPQARYAGDSSLYGNAELRFLLTRFSLLFPGRLGALALTDAGRVWLDGESPGGWHTAYGGGLWASALDPAFTLRAIAARSEEKTRFYAGIGFTF